MSKVPTFKKLARKSIRLAARVAEETIDLIEAAQEYAQLIFQDKWMKDMQVFGVEELRYIMQKAKEDAKTPAATRRRRREMLRKEFMPLSRAMEESFPTLRRLLRKGCGYSFNPYGTAYLKLQRWCRARLPILKRRVEKCLKDRAESELKKDESFSMTNEYVETHGRVEKEQMGDINGSLRERYSAKRDLRYGIARATLEDTLDLRHNRYPKMRVADKIESAYVSAGRKMAYFVRRDAFRQVSKARN